MLQNYNSLRGWCWVGGKAISAEKTFSPKVLVYEIHEGLYVFVVREDGSGLYIGTTAFTSIYIGVLPDKVAAVDAAI